LFTRLREVDWANFDENADSNAETAQSDLAGIARWAIGGEGANCGPAQEGRMLRQVGWTVAVVLLLAQVATGQAPQPSQPPEKLPLPLRPPTPLESPQPSSPAPSAQQHSSPAPSSLGPSSSEPISFAEPPPPSTVYVDADYLRWWVLHGPAPTLLTTAPNNGLNATGLTGGILGKPGTIILFDGSSLNYGAFNAVRLAAGVNVGSEGFWSLEASGFYLPQRSINFNIAGGSNGTPLLTVPFLDAATGQQASLDISSQDAVFNPFLTGGIAIHSDIQVWGFEANAIAHSIRTGERSVDVFAGIRTLGLNENLSINQIITPVQTGNITLQFPTTGQGAADYFSVVGGSPVQVFDSFSTRNQFFGTQFGSRFRWDFGRLSADLTAKVAVGITHQEAIITGFSSAGAAINPNTGAVMSNLLTPGGVFALKNNIGSFSQNPFSIAPEIGLNLTWPITTWLRLRVGYSALYWSNVARPGAQIDPVLNSKLIPTGALLPTNTLPIGAFIPGAEQGRPYFTFHDSAFWAQGVHVGFDIRY
jgi:hypothetical protein